MLIIITIEVDKVITFIKKEVEIEIIKIPLIL